MVNEQGKQLLKCCRTNLNSAVKNNISLGSFDVRPIFINE
jgi:hypothetical protein